MPLGLSIRGHKHKASTNLPNTAVSSFLLTFASKPLHLCTGCFMPLAFSSSTTTSKASHIARQHSLRYITGASMSEPSSQSQFICYGNNDESHNYDRRLSLGSSHALVSKSSVATFNSVTTVVTSTPSYDNSFSPELPDDSRGSSNSPPWKRAGTPEPHKTFWLYDGSIVLNVQNTLFRVHQTILANHSEVFADLFTVPQPEGEHKIDGCHVVCLYDNENDFVDLLNAVYIPDHFESLPGDADLSMILTFIEGILRLSTKYMIRYLRQRCISILQSLLPATFEAYEAMSQLPSHSDRYRSDPIMRAIRIAQETNVPEILPYAYYCLARFSHKRFLKERPGDISWRDKTVVLVGRERLHWAQMSMSHAFLIVFRRSPSCQSPLCAHSHAPHAKWHDLEQQKAPHPLRAFHDWNQLNVCADCVAYCQAVHWHGRREVWKYLPTWFELPNWEELKEAQNR